jgi:predicted phosphoribosyltransferase
VARLLNLRLDVAIARKVQLPDEPEASFGAIGPDDVLVLNDDLIKAANLTQDIIERQMQKARQSVRWREEIFQENEPFPELKRKIVIIVDDGLASGYTILAIIRFARESGAIKVIVAVPTASERAAEMMLQEADEVYVLNVRRRRYSRSLTHTSIGTMSATQKPYRSCKQIVLIDDDPSPLRLSEVLSNRIRSR